MASDAPPNGEHVTWRELNLVLVPMKEQVDKIADAVEALVAEKNQRAGAAVERAGWIGSRRFLITTIFAAAAAVFSSVATLVWLAVS